MVDSCFKFFRNSKCYDKSTKDRHDSFDNSSLFSPSNNGDKCGVTENHKSSLINSMIDKNENENVMQSNKAIVDHHYDNDNDFDDEFDVEEYLILRPHNQRKYLYSTTSTIASNNDVLSSDEENNNETLDILYPLHNEICLTNCEDSTHHSGTDKKNKRNLSSFRRISLIIFCR